jgi:hypothetical protein
MNKPYISNYRMSLNPLVNTVMVILVTKSFARLEAANQAGFTADQFEAYKQALINLKVLNKAGAVNLKLKDRFWKHNPERPSTEKLEKMLLSDLELALI